MTGSAGTSGGNVARPATTSAAPVTAGKVALYCLATMSVATAVIHFAVSGSHFRQYWLYGLFMLVVAWLQLLWAIAAVTRKGRLLLWAGTVVNACVIVVYIITRTAGDIVGPAPHTVEPFGFGDALCTVLEAIVVIGCAALLAGRFDQPVRRQGLVIASAATGTVTAALLSVALVAGGPEMVMSMASASAASTHQALRQIHLATSSPGGDITMPDPTMQMGAGMQMASSAGCDASPTKAQQQAAVRLVDASWQQASKYQSLAVAQAAGYRPITPTGAPVVHYLNVSYYLATMLGGPVLDTARPQSLVYANTPNGAVLVAAMYITRRGGPTPEPGGCLTQWHVHTNLCLRGAAGVVGVLNAAHPVCPAGSRNRVTPPMMHIWFVPIPGGPTAIDATNRQIVDAAMRVKSPHNGMA